MYGTFGLIPVTAYTCIAYFTGCKNTNYQAKKNNKKSSASPHQFWSLPMTRNHFFYLNIQLSLSQVMDKHSFEIKINMCAVKINLWQSFGGNYCLESEVTNVSLVKLFDLACRLVASIVSYFATNSTKHNGEPVRICRSFNHCLSVNGLSMHTGKMVTH